MTTPGICLECGGSYVSVKAFADFCGRPCRQAWNNRRLMRGAEIYDLFMALRFERGASTGLKVWTLACRLLAIFRDQDLQERGGRRSWRSPHVIIARHPYLMGEVLSRNITGVKR